MKQLLFYAGLICFLSCMQQPPTHPDQVKPPTEHAPSIVFDVDTIRDTVKIVKTKVEKTAWTWDDPGDLSFKYDSAGAMVQASSETVTTAPGAMSGTLSAPMITASPYPDKHPSEAAKGAPTGQLYTFGPCGISQETGGTNNAKFLFDGNPQTYWFPGWAAASYPAVARVDFGSLLKISRIRVYDGTGIPDLTVEGFASARPSDIRTFSKTFHLDKYQAWQDFTLTIPAEANYARVTLSSAQGDSQVGEVEFYSAGDVSPPNPVDSVQVTPPTPDVDTATTGVVIPPSPSGPDTINATLSVQMQALASADAGSHFGTKAFPWTPTDLPIQSLYLASGWLWRPDGLAVEPFYQGGKASGPGYGLDSYLRDAKAHGRRTMLVIHQTPEWFRPTGNQSGSNDEPPIKIGADPTDPASYADYAKMLFQVTARHGAKAWPVAALRLDHGPIFGGWTPPNSNPVLSGAADLYAISFWNEEKWWKKGSTTEGQQYIEPEAMAAMMSACADGHEGRLGPGVGIWTADQSMQIIAPALSGFDEAYILRMDRWFTAHRTDKTWPCNFLDFHNYSNIGNVAGQWPPTWNNGGAINPEADPTISQTLPKLVAFAHQMGKGLIISEFGVDTERPAPGQENSFIWWMYPVSVPGKTAEQIQADWIPREHLELMRYGVALSFSYNGNDEAAHASGSLYQSSGLLRAEALGFSPKPAYTAVQHLAEEMSGYAYARDLSTTDARVMEFHKIQSNGMAPVKYAYWLPTRTNATKAVQVGNVTRMATESVQFFQPGY